MDEFAFGSSWSPLPSTAQTTWDTRRVPGGSSGVSCCRRHRRVTISSGPDGWLNPPAGKHLCGSGERRPGNGAVSRFVA